MRRSVTPVAALVLIAALGSISWGQTSAASQPIDKGQIFDIPRLDNIAIDGKADDWADRGFAVHILCFEQGQLPAPDDFNPRLRVAWDARGLLVLVDCTDDVGIESEDVGNLWRADCIELFAGGKRGGTNFYQLVVGPGIDPKQPAARMHFHNVGKIVEPEGGFKAQVASSTVKGRYTCEILLPWSNLKLTPAKGDELALQLYVNDFDGQGDKRRALWFPRGETHADSTAMHRIRLADKASRPQELAASGYYDKLRRTKVSVLADAALAGKTAVIREGDRQLGETQLKDEGNRAVGVVAFAMPPMGQTWQPLDVVIDGREPVQVILPDARELRAKELVQLPIEFDPFVFAGAKFPTCVLRNAREVEDIIGPFELVVDYYDAQYNKVKTAEKPGRYGAVITIKPESGRPLTRYRTIYRMESDGPMWRVMEPWNPQAVGFPAGMGIDAEVAAKRTRDVETFIRDGIWSSLYRNGTMATVLAGLREAKPSDPCDCFHDAAAMDRQWWLGFKRSQWGAGKTFTKPFATPRKEQGLKAPVIREGSLKDAGMKADAAERLDALLSEWAGKSDEGFAVCVARHGVIILHKAYGARDGKPMTVDTPSWMASITKFQAGNLMWQAVDQGLVSLDDPVGKYLPPLADARSNRPITIRDCYVHTTGLWGHWGDWESDYEHIVAEYSPSLKVGVRYEYNGAGLALGSKVLEQLSGKCLPKLYCDHLYGPLGCTKTSVADSGGGCSSIPLDMAKVAQMALNQGAYGDLRFYRPETLKQVLPERQTKTLGQGTQVVAGIGCVWMDEEILGEGTFGHGAASSATFRVSPKHDLVVIMTRNGKGTGGFDQYHKKFLQAIVEGIEK
jgi:CubicO group peptidase (beta-lactamase class C family)